MQTNGHKNDDLVLEKLKNADMPVILVINKIDTLENKNHALPLIQERAKLMNFAEIAPVSALPWCKFRSFA